jgi:hypothetical protein
MKFCALDEPAKKLATYIGNQESGQNCPGKTVRLIPAFGLEAHLCLRAAKSWNAITGSPV